MSNLLAQYYRGITQRLRSEADYLHSIVQHHGLQGAGNEAALRDLVRSFIPKRYAVGTGIVVDRHGTPSRQSDIIIYDAQSYPALFALGSVHLFPVELVYATVEVKTTLDSDKANQALTNIESVRSLDMLKEPFVAWLPGGSAETISPTPPLGFVFSYNSVTSQFATFCRWFKPDAPERGFMYPTLVCCMDQGIVRCENLDHPIDANWYGHSMYLCDENDGTSVPVEDRNVHGSPARFVLNGMTYPVKFLGSERVAIDESRVLLYFLLLVAEMLAQKHLNMNHRFSQHYLSTPMKWKRTISLRDL